MADGIRIEIDNPISAGLRKLPAKVQQAIQEVVDETLNATEQVQGDGFTIYRVYTASGSSVELSATTSLAIINAFRPGQTLRDVGGVPSDCGVVLWKSFRHAPFQEDENQAWYIQPVQVNWRVHVSNPAVF